jgi:hypothetical protein
MTLYEIALFVHIVGAMGAFVGLGLESDGRVRLAKAASAEQVSSSNASEARCEFRNPLRVRPSYCPVCT